MANGKCSKCGVFLTDENCMPSVFSLGFGYCRNCTNVYHREGYKKSPERAKSLSANYRKNNPNKIKEG